MPMTEGGSPIRVLHVDDDPEFLDLAATYLERQDGGFTIETAPGADAGLDCLAAGEFDCVISDYEMPGMNGIDFLRAVREDYPDLPFVLFTGKGTGKSPARRSLRASPTTSRKTPAPNSTRCWQTES